MLEPGVYEQVINQEICRQLQEVPDACQAREPLDPTGASRILTDYLSGVVEKGMELVKDQGGGLDGQVDLANAIVSLIRTRTQVEDFTGLGVDPAGQQLLALLARDDPGLAAGRTAQELKRPETSLARTSLFTGTGREPSLYSELKKEILSASRVDMLVSFIRWSGLRLLLPELQQFTLNGGQLRVITTCYMGATDPKAVEQLAALPNTRLRISYDTRRTRLHAKAYMFYRRTGFHTAYVGSSNLSNAAISTGLEWNLKLTAQDQPEIMQKISATFDHYWASQDFQVYGEDQRDRLLQALRAQRHPGEDATLFFDIRPYPFQQEILDRLQVEREVRNCRRNLVVAATGTGKTVIAALDYRRFCSQRRGSPNRLLFVAHREEILRQSLHTFQEVLRDPNFGALMVGGESPDRMDHLFLSIQSFRSQSLEQKLDPRYYDYIVVDEFHHAAAPSYRALLDHFRPRILLGLTATPERMDGKSILDWFDGRIAAEIRLPEAIERRLLCPFQYFGVSDTVDLDQVRWLRGGYDTGELNRVYVFTREVAERRADHIIRSLDRYVADLEEVRGLGFCVSVEHARFMADRFSFAHIPSLALTGQSNETERRDARRRLVAGELRFLFVVDIYNEGVDIPEINTVLFLRPTESLTVFLQQLGRGLRLSQGKDCLTVLDFIGQANRRYNFQEKFQALLGDPRRSIRKEVEEGFPSVPTGCFIQLEKKASEAVLDNIAAAFKGKAALVNRIATFEEDSGLPLNLENFLAFCHLELQDIYNGNYSFARLCARAGKRPDFTEPAERQLTKAFPRLVFIDSRRWITFLLDLLPRLNHTDLSALPPLKQRMLQMFYYTVWQEGAAHWNDRTVRSNLRTLSASPVMLEDLLNLLRLRYSAIDFLDEPVDLGFDSPLDLHCTYTRDQILTALDCLTPANIREGVRWFAEKKLDVFLITLNKTDKDYSPTTMYQDYAISRDLFHWQSQSTTSADGKVGQRYIHHQELGSRVALFVRENKRNRLGAAPYTFLGTAVYLQHTGSRPMSITWKLDRPIPAKYLPSITRTAAG